MSSKTGQREILADWEELLASVQSNAAELPDLGSYIEPLERVLSQAKQTALRREQQRRAALNATKVHQDLIQQGRDLAMRLRSLLKAHYGIHSERLLEYGSRPVRRKSGGA